jgi:branched-subunit amino acid ABC-type transport system permease component
MWGDLLGQAFMGLSLGSVLLLAALGLAITYGLLGANMAHGEMLMLGAWLYLDGWSRRWAQFAPQWTWRCTDCRTAGVHFANLTLPWNRIVVLGFVLLVLFFTWLILNKTRLGLNVRAVTQNRSMAACCGVPTGRVDMLAFGLGRALPVWRRGVIAAGQRRAGTGPGLHHRLVPGGGARRRRPAGGSVAAAFGLGIFNKILEPQMGAVLGKILILVAIILFIQKRPQGLFALKGRVID